MKNFLIRFLKKILPQKARNILFHVGFNLAPDEFKEFAFKYAFAPNMELGLNEIRKRGFSPQTIVDIGAYEGNWSKMAKKIWPKASITMFEANMEKKAILNAVALEIGAKLHFALLGPTDDSTVEFFVMESGSSVYEETSPLNRTKIKMSTSSLDRLILEDTKIDLLKIDTQGYELQVLLGAERVLKKTKSVLLEVSLIQINKDAPLLHDVLQFMKQRGFVSYDILEIHRRPLDGATNQIDILFVEEKSALIHDKSHF